MTHSITLVILALNEEPGLKETYALYKETYCKHNLDHEIIIINDGSNDRTGDIADEIGKSDPTVKVIHHEKSLGMGYGYREAYLLSEKEYFMYTGAYNPVTKEDLSAALEFIGKTDMVLCYIRNPEIRPVKRQFLSSLYTRLLNMITGLDLNYYNCLYLCRTSCLKTVALRSVKHTYSAELVTKLVKKWIFSYVQSPISIKASTTSRKSKALTTTNFIDAARFFMFLIYDLYFAKEGSDNKQR